MLLVIFKVSGHSMEPTLLQGQTILVSSVPFFFSKPKVGNIVAFMEKSSGTIFVKRIVKMNKNNYFLKGDNEKDSKDSRMFGWVERKEIVGKVICNIK